VPIILPAANHFVRLAGQFRTTVIAELSARCTGRRNCWPSGVTTNRPSLMMPGTSNSFCGALALNVSPGVIATDSRV
jgi:hypothetical protein